jgi:hypothetical protein
LNNPHVDALIQIMPPTHGADEEVDWDAVEAQLGTRLPADYRAFVAVYGGGSIGDELGILLPLQPVDSIWRDGTIADEIPNFRYYWEEDGGVAGIELGADALLPWGANDTGDMLGWLMTGSDPDRWPVLVWRRQKSWDEPPFALFDCGMAEFLRRLMLAEFDECPVSDLSLWGCIKPFVNWREEQRRSLARRSAGPPTTTHI